MTAAGHTPRPLAGLRIGITRPRERAGSWRDALHEAGAEVVELPAISLAPLDDAERASFHAVLRRFGDLPDPWLAVTSPTSAEHLLALLDGGLPGDPWRIAAVGAATRDALGAGARVDLCPERASGAEVAAAILAADRADADGTAPAVLHVSSDRGRPELVEAVRAAGGAAEQAPVCVHRPVASLDRDLARALDGHAASPLDALAFASPSAAEALWRACPDACAARLARTPAVCIGATTARAAIDLGYRRVTVALGPTPPELVAALARALA